MGTRMLLFAGVMVALATPALAFHCPADVKAIDAALAKMSLPAATMAEVKQLRDQGEAEHKAGKHKEAVDTLAKAMRTILTNM